MEPGSDLTAPGKATDDQYSILINIAQIDISRDQYKFNAEKTKTITINCKSKPTLTLNNQVSQSEAHLAIQHT